MIRKNYKNGFIDGLFEEYYENGQLKATEGLYDENGVKPKSFRLKNLIKKKPGSL